jgi:NAD kinase
MNKFKFTNILIVLKTSKLNYLITKFGTDQVKSAEEFDILNSSMETHHKNTQTFLSHFKTYSSVNVDIYTDNFLKNDELSKAINSKKYNLIFSLGGDGTFLRTAQHIDDMQKILIGVNTDSQNSTGYYCPIHAGANNLLNNINNILENKFTTKFLNKLEITYNKGDKSYFINDLYFGEKFLGRISKYNLEVINKGEVTGKKALIKSSGVIFSTCK